MIIGFGYKLQVGKTTAAKYLEIQHDFIRDSFARSLKEGVAKGVFGLTDKQLTDDKEVVDDFWSLTPREILQKAGTDAFRKTFGPDIWVKTLQRRISLKPEMDYVIDDVRFPNEAQAIKDMGGVLINIVRKNAPNNTTHISETILDTYSNWDYTINNNSSIQEFTAQVDIAKSMVEVLGKLKVINNAI